MRRALRESRDIHIKVPRDLYESLAARAAAENIPVSMLIRRILRSALGV
ncbi:MAG: ribbon-helix-helix protein, CopG family [Nitrososphaerota archaeon]